MARVTPAWIAARARQLNIDPSSALAVMGQEGGGGGIGDSGHAFGPFQLNNAGGVITGKFPGQSPQQINDWAWSPAGVNYALAGIQKVAGGLKGPAATHAIVYGFERPADPAGEYSRAVGSPTPVTAALSPPGGAAMGTPAPTAPTRVAPKAAPAKAGLPAAVQAALRILAA